ncbi:MAG: transcription elongation factor GreA [Atopobiaceae bacterium]|nr:transcription elongation factor GreA [Atopobiaceae bacterium]
MAGDEIILTKEGRKELEKELAWRLDERKAEIDEQLRVARGFGDLSENAEYDAAREAQAQNESRINEINHILATAKDADQIIAGEGGLVAAVGASVELEDERGKVTTFGIVGTTETNSLQFKISNESPLGAALIGHVVGDTVSFVTPAGKVREYTIRNITAS